jgi:hypothetical protein
MENTESNTQLFAGDCMIYSQIMDSSDIDNLQKKLKRLVEISLQNEDKSVQK